MDNFIALLGLMGGFAFGFAAVPAAWATLKLGRSIGTPVSAAWAILAGCILLYNYLTLLHGFDWILTAIYGVEAVSWSTIIWFHYVPVHKGWRDR